MSFLELILQAVYWTILKFIPATTVTMFLSPLQILFIKLPLALCLRHSSVGLEAALLGCQNYHSLLYMHSLFKIHMKNFPLLSVQLLLSSNSIFYDMTTDRIPSF
jgi:hypothetical protein